MDGLMIYVCHPDRGDIEANIADADRLARLCWQELPLMLGCDVFVLSPVQNSARMDGVVPDEVFLNADLLALSKCDGIVMGKHWVHSSGCSEEFKLASRLHLMMFNDMGDHIVRVR